MEPYHSEDIAVIGIGLHFPGDATDPESFYDLLLHARSALAETPKDRYNVEAFYHPDKERLGAVSSLFPWLWAYPSHEDTQDLRLKISRSM
jgi:acyl transferase domain-containing protein